MKRLPMLGVGDVLDGATIHAQVFLNPTDHGYNADDIVYLRLTHLPAQPGCAARSDTTQRWMLGFGTTTDPQDNLLTSDPTFEALFETVKTNAAITFAGALREQHWLVAEQMVCDFLVNSYDPNDKAEAAEQMVVALGGTPSVLPASLTHSDADADADF